MFNINEITLAVLKQNSTYELCYDVRNKLVTAGVIQTEIYETSISDNGYNVPIATFIIDRERDIVSYHIIAYSGNNNDIDVIDTCHIIKDHDGLYLESIVTGEIVTIRKKTIKKAMVKKSCL